jgi:hypothetical protein
MGLLKIQPALEQSPPRVERKGPLGLQKTTKIVHPGFVPRTRLIRIKSLEWYWQGSGSYHWQVPPLWPRIRTIVYHFDNWMASVLSTFQSARFLKRPIFLSLVIVYIARTNDNAHLQGSAERPKDWHLHGYRVLPSTTLRGLRWGHKGPAYPRQSFASVMSTRLHRRYHPVLVMDLPGKCSHRPGHRPSGR